MAMKDEEYLKRNILAVYYKHEPQYTNLPYYRFMGQKELETLFFNKVMYFTDPVEWKKSSTGDANETYYEDWFRDKDNIYKAYRLIKESSEKGLGQYCTQQYIMGVYSDFVAAAALLQQRTFCYCVSNKYADAKMVQEYHKKYGRNFIIKYKNDFYKKLSILDQGNYVPMGIYLFADIMPMVYINCFEDYIEKYICESHTLDQVAQNAFDFGAFLKHSSFSYEHEIRVKLRIHLDEYYNLQTLSNEFYRVVFALKNDDEIVSKSMAFIDFVEDKVNYIFDDVRDKIKDIAGKQCFELKLSAEISINDIVDSIVLHDKASTEEKSLAYKLRDSSGISIIETDFDKFANGFRLI